MLSGEMVSNMHDCGRGGRGKGLKLIGIIIVVVGPANSRAMITEGREK